MGDKTFYQVAIETKEKGKNQQNETYFELDKTDKQEMINDIIIPFLKKEDFQFDGYFINAPEIKRLEVKSSKQTTEELSKYENDHLPNNFIMFISKERIVHYDKYMTDITKEIIQEAKNKINTFSQDQISNNTKKGTAKEYKKVFIVHGRDDLAKNEVARFIEKIGLEAVILHEQENKGMTIIEKIEHYTDVDYGIVLYTPCDIGTIKDQQDFKPRARQNVVFEHGYLIGKLKRENVCALVKENIEIPNDISGLVYIDMDKLGAWKFSIAKELKKSGYTIDMNKI
jgi:predicted nucleotide-binding protein